MKFLKSAHFGPTFVVTLVGFLLSKLLFTVAESFVIAAAVFCGQLCVGWSNELVDADSDRIQNRLEKPLVNGSITTSELQRGIALALPLCVLLSILGPLHLWGGLTHLLGVGCGVAYNFYFKSRSTSPLPYAVAFGALVGCVFIGAHRTPPWWVVVSGSLLGIAAHFANVLKDMDEDRVLGVMGLPQRLGGLTSIRVAGVVLAIVALLLSLNISKVALPLLVAAGLAEVALLVSPKRGGFLAILVLALIDVFALLAAGSSIS